MCACPCGLLSVQSFSLGYDTVMIIIYFAVQVVPAQVIAGSFRQVLHPSDTSPGFSGAQPYLLGFIVSWSSPGPDCLFKGP